MSFSLCTTFSPKCRVSCWPFGKKKRAECVVVKRVPSDLATASTHSVLLVRADNVQITGLLEEGTDPSTCDVYVFDAAMRYVSCSGPSIAGWFEDGRAENLLGKCPFDPGVMPPSFQRTFRPLYERVLAGKNLKFGSIWHGETYLLTAFPIYDAFSGSRKVLGGVIVTQPCEGLLFDTSDCEFDAVTMRRADE